MREQALSVQPSTSRDVSSLRSGHSQFDFKTKGFLTFHNSVLLRGQERNDEWGNDIVRRICTVGDLHEYIVCIYTVSI